MVVELTEKIIQDAFAKTGIDQKYYPQYHSMAINRYEAFQNDNPDSEETPESECNAIVSLKLADEYISIYATETKKGHCHEWSHFYAFDCLSIGTDDMHLHSAFDSLEENERERELEIHAKSINNDPVFVEYYISVFKEHLSEPRKIAERYCCAYHRCIKEGKSVCYAMNYAELVSSGEYVDEYCSLYAEICDYAEKHGVKTDPSGFAFACADAYVNGLILKFHHLEETFEEDWQHEFLSKLLDREMREQEAEVDSSTFDVPSTRRKTHKEDTLDMMFPDGIDDGFSLPED